MNRDRDLEPDEVLSASSAGDAARMHHAIVDLTNSEMSKIITAGPLTSDTGGSGSFALHRRANKQSLADARRILEVLAQFRSQHEALHCQWTTAVGTPGYVKAQWRARDNALAIEYRETLTALGYPLTLPLLPWAAGDYIEAHGLGSTVHMPVEVPE